VKWLLLGSIAPSLLIAWAAGFVVRRRAARWGLVDEPSDRKAHAQPTPLGGGLAIWLGVAAPLVLGQLILWCAAAGWIDGARLPELVQEHLGGLRQQSPNLWAVLAGATAMMILGLVDDRRGLDWRIRLAAQFFVATAMVLLGFRLTLFIELPAATATLSVLWIVGLINSFNMLDNMDGLSAGVAAIAALMLAAVMLLAPGQPQLFVAGFLLVLVGALVGFLFHNRPPARLFMGDAGSYLIGFCLAIATLLATYAGVGAPRHALLAPLCVLAVPLYDTASVVWIRLREGRSPFHADRRHFSHRLVELGLSPTRAVLTIYLASATCGLGAFLLHRVDTVGAALVLLLVGCVLAIIAILETAGRKR
jgi:UDP-GlcNAc:undecaprenyl-phosphate GlcNAc-1-phosphate transferase